MTPPDRLPAVPKLGRAHLRLVTFQPAGSDTPRVGIVRENGRIVDLTTDAKAATLSFDPTSMLSLIAAGEDALTQVRAVAEVAPDGPTLDEVRLLAPLPNPTRNIFAVGWNYLEHFEEGKATRAQNVDYPAHPVFFTKSAGTVNGPYDPIPYDAEVSVMIDWECELAVVIGKAGINIPEADAMSHVFGYMVINDTSARNFAKKHVQWFKGKSLDGHGPTGPWIVPAAELDPDNLHLLTRVNGVVKQDASTRQMYFKVARIIAELSVGMTLKPGDVIATGTPPGVGTSREPPEYLKPGDVMETEIVEIGTLRNTIRAVAA